MARPARGKSGASSSSAQAGQGTATDARGLVAYLGKADSRDLDRLIYERVRLGIVSALSVNERLSFSELKELLNTSDGNLSAHARRLEDAGYVSCKKTFSGRTPRTEYRLTARGRRALTRYLDHMEALISATRGE